MAEESEPKEKVVVAPTPPKKDGEPLKEVWFSCRATPGCEGKKAVIVWTKGKSGQGSVTRYRCLTCGKTWHVRL